MTALVPVSGRRRVVRLFPPPSRTTQLALPAAPVRHALGPARHTIAPGRHVVGLYLTPDSPGSLALREFTHHRGPGRHRTPLPRRVSRARAAHAPLNQYEVLLFWMAGALLRLRVAVVGIQLVDE